ncbi:MAG: hypothetical protein WC721_21820, partial [Victivallaceae bacterium]
MRECAPLAGPANAGEKSEKSGKPESVMLNDYPKYRSQEARECGSVPRLRVPRMRERKARKVENRKALCSTTIQSIG